MLVTKGNLLANKESLRLAKLGYELMDRKRVILMQELSKMMDDAKEVRTVIDEAYTKAYESLQKANVSMGVINRLSELMPVDDTISIVYRSVMGIEIPRVFLPEVEIKIPYALSVTNSNLDEAYLQMVRVKQYTAKLAELDNGMFRLARAVEKSRKRANALEQIVIPNLENDIKVIGDALEEKEREEFIRMKLVKKM